MTEWNKCPGCGITISGAPDYCPNCGAKAEKCGVYQGQAKAGDTLKATRANRQSSSSLIELPLMANFADFSEN